MGPLRLCLILTTFFFVFGLKADVDLSLKKKIKEEKSAYKTKDAAKSIKVDVKQAVVKGGEVPFYGEIKSSVNLHKQILVRENLTLGKVLADRGLNVSFRVFFPFSSLRSKRSMDYLSRFSERDAVIQFGNKISDFSKIPKSWQGDWTFSFALEKLPKWRNMMKVLSYPVELRFGLNSLEKLEGMSRLKEFKRLKFYVDCKSPLNKKSLKRLKKASAKFKVKSVFLTSSCKFDKKLKASGKNLTAEFRKGLNIKKLASVYLELKSLSDLKGLRSLPANRSFVILDPGQKNSLEPWMLKFLTSLQ